jgi:AcrR family transcriptional regulator
MIGTIGSRPDAVKRQRKPARSIPNKPAADVRDRRVQRTRELLHGALGALIREKPYDAIVVRDILSRANVGRSTFYSHFRDKDELLVSGIHDIVGATDASDILRFSLPMFEHIDRHRRGGEDRMGARGRTIVHERMRRVIARQIADELAATGGALADRIPCELVVRHVTTTFIGVLDWWVSSHSRLSPAEADAIFRRLVRPALSGY